MDVSTRYLNGAYGIAFCIKIHRSLYLRNPGFAKGTSVFGQRRVTSCFEATALAWPYPSNSTTRASVCFQLSTLHPFAFRSQLSSPSAMFSSLFFPGLRRPPGIERAPGPVSETAASTTSDSKLSSTATPLAGSSLRLSTYFPFLKKSPSSGCLQVGLFCAKCVRWTKHVSRSRMLWGSSTNL